MNVKIIGIVCSIFIGTFLGNVLWDMMRFLPVSWGGDAAKAAITTTLLVGAGFFVLRK